MRSGTAIACLLAAAAAGAENVDFARDVQPILYARCAACHMGDNREAGLSLHTRAGILQGGRSGPAVVPGSSRASLLIQRVTGFSSPVMPFGGEPLSDREIGILRAWIDQGAEWTPQHPQHPPQGTPRWATPLAPRRPELPAASASSNPLDAFLEAYFRRTGFSPPAPVSDSVFARRVYLDLWGLPPTPEQRREFLADPAPDRRGRLVDRLLVNRRHYAEHWISFWNDLLRNDEGVVYHGARQSITSWLLKALQDNLPYDRFVAALLNPAGPGDPAGYLIGVNWRGDISASQTPVMQAAQNSAQVFLGVNLKCNACHDSFISRWKLKDAYGMAGFFSAEELDIYRCETKTGEKAGPRFLFPELGGADTGASLAERRAAAARLFTSPENGRFARTLVNRLWRRLLGRGLVEPVDDLDAEPWDRDLLDWLAADFVEHQYDLQLLLRRILTSPAYQLPAAAGEPSAREADYRFRGPLARRLTAEQFMDGVSAITGEWRVLQPSKPGAGTYSREWLLKSTPLSRALGRPIRDQVFTERGEQATTLQGLELVNGETLGNLLRRGARRLIGQWPSPAANRFDSGLVRAERVAVDIDIAGARELRLLIEDADSYDRDRVVAGWAAAELVGPAGAVRLADFDAKPGLQRRTIRIKGETFPDALAPPVPSETVYPIAGRGFTRFRAVVGIDESSLKSDISPRIRFFVFTEAPDRQRLVQVGGSTPVPAPAPERAPLVLAIRLYQQALGRDPEAEERRVAAQILAGSGPAGAVTAEGLEDLLWSLFLSPEFQYIW